MQMFPAFIDAHFHVTPSLLPFLNGIPCIANADNPEEYRWLEANELPGMVISAGIHPWKAAETDWSEMEPLLHTCAVIGEIGLDSVWCNTDPKIQQEVFHRQLKLAHTLQTPVILHTKGMEKEVLHAIRQYPNRYLVHWYSCCDFLEEYMALDCWFTAGPDVCFNPHVEQLVKTVPLDRLLLESDGLEGISWGQGISLVPSDYPEAMGQHLHTISLLRGISSRQLLTQLLKNLTDFLF